MAMIRRNRTRDDQATTTGGDERIPDAEPRPEDIARRAYELYERRGAEHGHDQDDWLEAERELRESPTGKRPARRQA